MKIGFLGDVHGYVFTALAVVVEWQRRAETPLDLVVQVGDLGAFPDAAHFDRATAHFAGEHPGRLDFLRLHGANGRLADALRAVRRELHRPIHFIRGNHDSATWLRGLPRAPGGLTVAVDAFDLFRYVPDGTTIAVEGVRFAFLGGVEHHHDAAILLDTDAYTRLLALPAGEVDVLVTHDPPFGAGAGFRETRPGSPLVRALDAHLAPPLHVGGHVHAMMGPLRYGATTYYGLAIIRERLRRDPTLRVRDGWFAVWDTDTDTFTFVIEEWLETFDRDFTVARFTARFAQ